MASFLISPQHAPLPNESVYDISNNLSAVPSMYSTNEPLPQAINVGEEVEEVELPLIDLQKLSSDVPEERAQALADLRFALEEWGFFQLVNHGITETLKDNLLKAAQAFFDLPMEEKAKYPDRFAETHILDPIRYGTSFNLKADEVKYWRDFLKLIVHPEFNCPPNPPEFGELMREFTTAIRLVGRKMLSGVWESLGIDEKYMTEALKLDSTFQILICNLYPKCPQPDLALGLPPHSDHGLLGILYQNDVDGLELIHNGKWVRVKGEPNSFLINTGDHLEIATNGRYKSIVHRVVTNQAQTRMSITTTACPGEDAVVLPAPELVTDESPAKFRGMTYRDFIECQQNNRLQDKSILDSIRINKNFESTPSVY